MAEDEKWLREEAGMSEEAAKALIAVSLVANNKDDGGDKVAFATSNGTVLETSNSGDCPEENDNEIQRGRSCSVTSQTMFVTQQEAEKRMSNRAMLQQQIAEDEIREENVEMRVIAGVAKAEKDRKAEEAREAEFFSWKDIESQYYQVVRDSKRPQWCKNVWYVITTVLMVLTIYMVYKLLYAYFQYSSYNHTSTTWLPSVVLPAITICSPNLLNYTRMKEELDEADIDLMLDLLSDVEFMSGEDQSGINMSLYSQLDNLTKSGGDKYDIFRDFYMNPHEFSFIKDYDFKFAKKFYTLNQDEYNRMTQPNELGWCLNLNDDGMLNQTISGSNGGFTIDLNANLEHYLHSTSSSGFVVIIRDANETVLLGGSGYIVEPGAEVFIRIDKNMVSRLHQPYGHCENKHDDWRGKDGNIYRTARECTSDQKMELMAEHCECLPWYLIDKIDALDDDQAGNAIREVLTKKWASAVDKSVNVSAEDFNLDDLACTFAQQVTCDSIVQAKVGLGHSKHCDHSCHFNLYDVAITQSTFPPTERYFDEVLAQHTKNGTYEYARQNFVRLHIFYGEIRATTISQVQSYQLASFVAELGGTMDLLIGLSFFTMFQMFEIAVAYVMYKIWGQVHTHESPTGSVAGEKL